MFYPDKVLGKGIAINAIYYPFLLWVVKVVSEFEQGNEHPCDAPASGAVDHEGAGAGRAVAQSGMENIPESVPVPTILSRCHRRNLNYIGDVFAVHKQAQFPIK